MSGRDIACGNRMLLPDGLEITSHQQLYVFMCRRERGTIMILVHSRTDHTALWGARVE